MAKKRLGRQSEGTGVEKEIKDAMGSGKLVMGTRVVFREMKNKSLGSIVYAENLPDSSKESIDKLVEMSGAKVQKFSGDSMRLGEACGKPFNILLIGIRK